MRPDRSAGSHHPLEGLCSILSLHLQRTFNADQPAVVGRVVRVVGWCYSTRAASLAVSPNRALAPSAYFCSSILFWV